MVTTEAYYHSLLWESIFIEHGITIGVDMCIPPCSKYIVSPRAKVQTNQIFKLTRLDSERFMSVIQKKCALACVISLLRFKGKCDLISGFIDATKSVGRALLSFVVYYWNVSGKFGEQHEK